MLGLKRFLTGPLDFHLQPHSNLLYLLSQTDCITTSYRNFGRYTSQHSPSSVRWDMQYRCLSQKHTIAPEQVATGALKWWLQDTTRCTTGCTTGCIVYTQLDTDQNATAPSGLLSFFFTCPLQSEVMRLFVKFLLNAETNYVMLCWAGESYVNSDRRSSALLLPPMPAPVASAEGPRYDNSSVGSSMPSSWSHKHRSHCNAQK